MAQYRKALKNYATSARLDKMIADIQQILIDFGATGILLEYAQDGSGMLSGIAFKIIVDSRQLAVRVPFDWEKVAEVLKQQGYFKDEQHAYRVAIANVRDWIDSQMAYYATQMVEFPQIFLPYMQNNSGKTFYEIAKDSQFMLGDSQSNFGPEKSN